MRDLMSGFDVWICFLQTGVSAAAPEGGVHSTQHSVGSLCVCPGTPTGDLAGGGAGELCHQPEVREGPEGEGGGL